MSKLEEARCASEVWAGPPFLKASWMYMHSYTLRKPLHTLQRMRDYCDEVTAAHQLGSSCVPDESERIFDDLDDWLHNSI